MPSALLQQGWVLGAHAHIHSDADTSSITGIHLVSDEVPGTRQVGSVAAVEHDVHVILCVPVGILREVQRGAVRGRAGRGCRKDAEKAGPRTKRIRRKLGGAAFFAEAAAMVSSNAITAKLFGICRRLAQPQLMGWIALCSSNN